MALTEQQKSFLNSKLAQTTSQSAAKEDSKILIRQKLDEIRNKKSAPKVPQSFWEKTTKALGGAVTGAIESIEKRGKETQEILKSGYKKTVEPIKDIVTGDIKNKSKGEQLKIIGNAALGILGAGTKGVGFDYSNTTQRNIIGQLSAMGGEISGGAVISALGAYSSDEAKQKLNNIINSPVGRLGLEAIGGIEENWNNFKVKYPDIARDIEGFANFADLATSGIAGAGIKKGAESATLGALKGFKKGVTEGAGALVKKPITAAEKMLERFKPKKALDEVTTKAGEVLKETGEKATRTLDDVKAGIEATIKPQKGSRVQQLLEKIKGIKQKAMPVLEEADLTKKGFIEGRMNEAIGITKAKAQKFAEKSIENMDPGQWALEKGLKGTRTQMTEQAQNILDNAYKKVREITSQVKTITQKSKIEGMEDMLKEIQKYFSKPGMEEEKRFATQMLQKTEYTGEELQKIKEALDHTQIIFNKSGDQKATSLAEGLLRIRSRVKDRLEDISLKEGHPDIGKLNNDVSMSHMIIDGMKNASAGASGNRLFSFFEKTGMAGAAGVGLATGAVSLPIIAAVYGVSKLLRTPFASAMIADFLNRLPKLDRKFLQNVMSGSIKETAEPGRMKRIMNTMNDSYARVKNGVPETIKKTEQMFKRVNENTPILGDIVNTLKQDEVVGFATIATVKNFLDDIESGKEPNLKDEVSLVQLLEDNGLQVPETRDELYYTLEEFDALWDEEGTVYEDGSIREENYTDGTGWTYNPKNDSWSYWVDDKTELTEEQAKRSGYGKPSNEDLSNVVKFEHAYSKEIGDPYKTYRDPKTGEYFAALPEEQMLTPDGYNIPITDNIEGEQYYGQGPA